MLFTDIRFIVAFPVASVFYFIIPLKMRKIWILAMNLIFIYSWGIDALKIILTEGVVSYTVALLKKKWSSTHPNLGKIFISIGLGSVLLYFLYCRYYNFVWQVFAQFDGREFTAKEIVAPIGISFYTLQIVGYLIDVLKEEEKVESNIINYMVFVTFFPLILSGPIERTGNFLEQLKTVENTKYSYFRVREGLLFILWGFFLKMVISNRATTVVSTVFDNYSSYKGLPLVIASVMFTIQLYADFSGYSYIAYGIGKILGFNIIENFKNPYSSETIRQFWRRWHISLSSWMRDYIYIPLGGSRCSKVRKYFNLAITFLVSGLWHGGGGGRMLYGENSMRSIKSWVTY